jgi:hypothetical protein
MDIWREFVQAAPSATLVPHLPVLDFIACMFTFEAFRLTESRSVPWWRTFLVCFIGYKGECACCSAPVRPHSVLTVVGVCACVCVSTLGVAAVYRWHNYAVPAADEADWYGTRWR